MSVQILCFALSFLAGVFYPKLTAAQSFFSGAEVGAHFGFSFGGDSNELIEERLGIQGLVPVAGPVEVAASVARFFSFPDVSNPDVTGSAWRSFFTVRIRPLGHSSFLSIGGGVSVGWFKRQRPPVHEISWSETNIVGILGFETPFKRVRPFTEFYLFGEGISLLLGVNLRFP